MLKKINTHCGIYCGFICSIKVEKFLRGTETHAVAHNGAQNHPVANESKSANEQSPKKKKSYYE